MKWPVATEGKHFGELSRWRVAAGTLSTPAAAASTSSSGSPAPGGRDLARAGCVLMARAAIYNMFMIRAVSPRVVPDDPDPAVMEPWVERRRCW